MSATAAPRASHDAASLAGLRFVGCCAYDGGDFEGWQTQPNGKGVQDALERRLRSLFRGAQATVAGAGRTDSGEAHRAARGNGGNGGAK